MAFCKGGNLFFEGFFTIFVTRPQKAKIVSLVQEAALGTLGKQPAGAWPFFIHETSRISVLPMSPEEEWRTHYLRC